MLAQMGKRWIASLGCAAALMCSSGAGATGLSIRTLGARELRVATIGYRIAAANAAMCRTPVMMSGMIVHDLTQYDPAARPAVSRAFSLNAGFGVLEIVPGTEAERVGLKIDDEIVAVGGHSVEDPAAFQQRSPSYTRVERFLTLLSDTLRDGSTDILVRRKGEMMRMSLSGRPGCGGEVKLTDSSTVNAWSDGKHVVLSTAIEQMASNDNELAFVIAHEMAHNILNHFSASNSDSRSLFGLLGLGASSGRNMETQADGFAVPLMSAGGYAPEGGISFLENARRRMWWDISLDHPGFGSRIRTVSAAILRLPQGATPYRTLALRGTYLAQPSGPKIVNLSSRYLSENSSGM